MARRKRDERRSTQHVSLDDLPPENAEVCDVKDLYFSAKKLKFSDPK